MERCCDGMDVWYTALLLGKYHVAMDAAGGAFQSYVSLCGLNSASSPSQSKVFGLKYLSITQARGVL